MNTQDIKIEKAVNKPGRTGYIAEIKVDDFDPNTVNILPFLNEIGVLGQDQGDYLTDDLAVINGVEAYVKIHYTMEIEIKSRTMEKLQSKIDAVKERMDEQQHLDIEIYKTSCSS